MVISKCWSGPLTATGSRFGLIVHHTDATREFAYDRESHFGKLDEGTQHGKGARLACGEYETRLETRIRG